MARKASQKNGQVTQADGLSQTQPENDSPTSHPPVSLELRIVVAHSPVYVVCDVCGKYWEETLLAVSVRHPDGIMKPICPICLSLPPQYVADDARTYARQLRKDADTLEQLAKGLETLEKFPDVAGVPMVKIANLLLETEDGLRGEYKIRLIEGHARIDKT